LHREVSSACVFIAPSNGVAVHGVSSRTVRVEITVTVKATIVVHSRSEAIGPHAETISAIIAAIIVDVRAAVISVVVGHGRITAAITVTIPSAAVVAILPILLLIIIHVLLAPLVDIGGASVVDIGRAPVVFRSVSESNVVLVVTVVMTAAAERRRTVAPQPSVSVIITAVAMTKAIVSVDRGRCQGRAIFAGNLIIATAIVAFHRRSVVAFVTSVPTVGVARPPIVVDRPGPGLETGTGLGVGAGSISRHSVAANVTWVAELAVTH
jgi:hypothetical protein